jgi:cytoskeletal protein CcmA (bactofilin family)
MFLKSQNNSTPPQQTVLPAQKQQQASATAKKAVPSVISADMNILGNIMSDGIVDFNIRCNSLVLRHNGKVNGEIHADTVQIYGKVKGLIKARSVHLHAPCCVEGIIMHEAISIEDGAVIDGKIKRTNKAPATPQQQVEIHDYEEPAEGDESGPKMLENIRLIAG